MKAQSAIEYLITYGWMFVAVAVVGGAVYSVIGSECVESTSGFDEGVAVTNFGTTGTGELSLEIENRQSEGIEIEEVVLEQDGKSFEYPETQDIGVSDSDSITLSDVTESRDCNTIQTEITYSTDSLTGQQTTGTITSTLSFEEGDSPEPAENLEAEYTE